MMTTARPMKLMTKSTGFSLIEVLITILVFAISLLGIAAMQVQALKGTADSGQRGKAVWLAQELTERMRANPEGVRNKNYLQAANCGSTPRMCSNYFDGSSRIAGDVCNSAEMAAFDVWELSCGTYQPTDDGLRGNPIHFLANAEITVECNNCPDPDALELPDDADLTVTVSWTGRTGGESSDDPDTATLDTGTQKVELIVRP